MRVPGHVSTLLVAYLALVANVGFVTLVLSPFHAVTTGGLAASETVLFAAAMAAWWSGGRPRPSVPRLPLDALTVAMLAVVVCILGYELWLALTVPANNWDSLTYHLARVAAWVQHGGIQWITNAPTDRMNQFQPLAEQEIFFLFAASGPRLYALPQYVAQLAILVAVYGTSRRLGFGVRGAVGSACLFSTFTLVALEATTSQNDLVAASFVAAAACLVLGTTRAEALLAGVALGLALGVKLTSVLVWPALALLVWWRGRATAARVAVGLGVGFVAVGLGGYLLNLVHTGHVLGSDSSRSTNSTSPSFPGSLRVGVHVLYRLFDLASLSNHLIEALAVVGIVAGLVVLVLRRQQRRSPVDAVVVSLAFLSPLVVLAAAHTIAYLAGLAGVGFDESAFQGTTNRRASEDYAAFGPLGSVLLVGAAIGVPVAYARSRAGRAELALALALPSFLVVLALTSKYNAFLTRFGLVAAVLVAPLTARLFTTAAASIALVATGAVIAFASLRDDVQKPASLHPWRMDEAQALEQTWQPMVGDAIRAYRRDVPAHACVGAILGRDEPSYVLWGPRLTHRLSFLPSIGALPQAYRDGLFYVVISVVSNAPSAEDFKAVGWRIRPLGSYWLLASAPHAGAGACV